MSKLKNYIIAFLTGAASVLLGITIYLLKKSKPVINADQYVDKLEQKVNKIKQKGKGNAQSVEVDQTTKLSRKEKRKQRREERKSRPN